MFSGLSEEKIWTTLKNNLSPQTSVTSAEQEEKAVLQITYNVTDEQVHTAFLSCLFPLTSLHIINYFMMCSVCEADVNSSPLFKTKKRQHTGQIKCRGGFRYIVDRLDADLHVGQYVQSSVERMRDMQVNQRTRS